MDAAATNNYARSNMSAIKKLAEDQGGALVAAGSADALTVNPTNQVLSSPHLAAGLRLLVRAISDNATTAPTFAPDGLTPAPIKRADGSALAIGSIKSGMYLDLVYNAGSSEWRAANIAPASVTGGDYQAFTASGTWTKPSGATSNAVTIVEAWGAGGGGGANATGGGGGGGGYITKTFPTSALGSTETVTVPAGGAISTTGGNASFGSWLTAYGGGAGANVGGGGGGGGGGETSAGAAGGSGNGGVGGGPQFAAAGTFGMSGGGGGGDVVGGVGYFGGGGGGGEHGAGGASLYGGGGGSGSSGGAGGTSKFAGAGGATTVAGSAPAGGGGRNAIGGRAEIRIWTIG